MDIHSALHRVKRIDTLSKQTADHTAQDIADPLAKARSYHDGVIAAMDTLREACDAMESIVPTTHWPLPTYNKMLFYC